MKGLIVRESSLSSWRVLTSIFAGCIPPSILPGTIRGAMACRLVTIDTLGTINGQGHLRLPLYCGLGGSSCCVKHLRIAHCPLALAQ